MGEIKAAVFSVTVDNERVVAAWLDDFQRAHVAARKAFDELCAIARQTPLIQLTVHRDAPDEELEAGEVGS